MNVIFLDFDGVWRGTNAAQALGGVADKQAIALIDKLLETSQALGETKLVVSSTHRIGYCREEMEKFLKDSGAKSFCKYLHNDWKTPVGQEHPFGRLKEINSWLAAHEVDKFVIIDDDWHDTTDGSVLSISRLVHVDSVNGFSFRDLARAIFILGLSIGSELMEDFKNHGRNF